MADIDLSNKVIWQSQFDPQWGDKSQQNVACNKTCKQILSKANFSTTGADGRVDVTVWDAGKKLQKAATWQKGMDLLDSQLTAGRPVMVGVNRSASSVGNTNQATSHFVIVVGKKGDDYWFYDVGTSHQDKGTSATNLLKPSDFLRTGFSAYLNNTTPYTLTEVRPTSTLA